MNTIIHLLEKKNNLIYIKREDLIPFCFGGNKVRKAYLFFNEIDKGGYDAVVTYGSNSSNHLRVIVNMAFQRKIECYIITTDKNFSETYNSQLICKYNTKIFSTDVHNVNNKIEEKIKELKNKGKTPYFIPGGGHGDLGTEAYVQCFFEILEFEKKEKIEFDYIFLASGTGTTQAGLICGKILKKNKKKIVGISIARNNIKGKEAILESIKKYFYNKGILIKDDIIEKSTIFTDKYIIGGYGKYNKDVVEVINNCLKEYGIPFDLTYTGKAYTGMKKYIKENNIYGKKILFIHTGGTPLFFDFLNITNKMIKRNY